MRIDIRGDKIKITPAIKSYIEEKIGKLNRYFSEPDVLKAYAVVRLRGNDQVIEITIPSPKFTLRAEVAHSDLYAAIDLALDRLEGQIRKNKSKMKKRFKNIIKYELEMDNEEEVEETIVKRKNVELIPMDEEEAILQMELLDHDFYLFKDLDTDKISVLYKRKNGSYGIIVGE